MSNVPAGKVSTWPNPACPAVETAQGILPLWLPSLHVTSAALLAAGGQQREGSAQTSVCPSLLTAHTDRLPGCGRGRRWRWEQRDCYEGIPSSGPQWRVGCFIKNSRSLEELLRAPGAYAETQITVQTPLQDLGSVGKPG